MAVFTETIKLDDQVSGPAGTAKSAMGALGTSTVAAQGALSQASTMTKPAGAAMGALGKSTFDAANAMKVGKETIGAAISGIKNAFASLAAGDVKGAIAGVSDAVAGLAKMLDLIVPGLGEAVSLVVQIVGGFAGITAGLIKDGIDLAISASQAKAQMISMFDALGAGEITGREVDDMLSDMSERLGQTKDSMVPLVQKFAAMGITGKEALERMTTAALSAKALVGGADSGAQAFETLMKKIQAASAAGTGLKIPLKGLGSLADMGLTVNDVAKKMGVSSEKLAADLKAGTVNADKFGDALQTALIEKGAGPLEKMGLSLKNLKGMFQQYIGDMFEDMSDAVDPFMAEVKQLFSIFSQSKPSGQAMKAGIGGFFREVFKVLTKVVPMVRHFLLDMIILGLKAYIAIKPIIAKLKEFAQSERGAALINKALAGLWFVLKLVGTTILVVVGAIALFVGALIAISVAAYTVVGAIVDFVSEVGSKLYEWVASAPKTASDFIEGLVSGITGGATAVYNAVTGLAGGAIDAAKNALGIASPSKVMMQIGTQTGEGFAGGLGDAANDVHGASSGMATAAVKGASEGGGAAPVAAASGGSTTIQVSVQIDGAGKSALEITEEMVSQVFERMALASGL